METIGFIQPTTTCFYLCKTFIGHFCSQNKVTIDHLQIAHFYSDKLKTLTLFDNTSLPLDVSINPKMTILLASSTKTNELSAPKIMVMLIYQLPFLPIYCRSKVTTVISFKMT